MRRLRILRILLPVLLAGFVVAIVVAVRSRPPRGIVPSAASTEKGARMEGFRFTDLIGGRRKLLVQARIGRMEDRGAFRIEGVERVEIDREGDSPLVLTAARGVGSGAQGKRVIRLEGGVTLHDDDLGLTLVIPTVEIDQVAGVVRSLGNVKVEGERAHGTASALVYSLRGEPARIFTLLLDGPGGEHVDAHEVTVPAGSRTALLEGDVHAREGGMEIAAERVALARSARGKLERADASPLVTGKAVALAGGSGAFAAREFHATWGPDGSLATVELLGEARVEHTRGMLAADRIAARALDVPGRFGVDASGNVLVTATLDGGPGELTADALTGTLARGRIEDGTASGNVRFAGAGTVGEAARLDFDVLSGSGRATLHAEGTQRASLANRRTRVAAETIVTDLRGDHLSARGRVEATLLPDTAKGAAARRVAAPFAPGEAVHFVSGSLESFEAGQRLVFKDDVRGWQGERALSADEVEMAQGAETLAAKGRVTTRMPRTAARATSDADYLQVTSDSLLYQGKAHTADYDGHVRARQSEGWLEAPHIRALLAESGGGVREIDADGGIRFEYRAPGAGGVPTTATGEGDRLTYDTATRTVRIFGDKGPATVRATGENAGTTVGRVLRYQLDTGALEVESGERDRAIIKTPKG